MEAARVPARPAPRLQVEPRPAHQEVVRDEDAAHRAEQRRVSDEPLEDVAGRVLHQPPRLDHDADHPGDQRPDTEGDAALPEVGEFVGRGCQTPDVRHPPLGGMEGRHPLIQVRKARSKANTRSSGQFRASTSTGTQRVSGPRSAACVAPTDATSSSLAAPAKETSLAGLESNRIPSKGVTNRS